MLWRPSLTCTASNSTSTPRCSRATTGYTCTNIHTQAHSRYRHTHTLWPSVFVFAPRANWSCLQSSCLFSTIATARNNDSNNNIAKLYNNNNNSLNNNYNNNLLQLIKWQTDDNEGTTRLQQQRQKVWPIQVYKDPVQKVSIGNMFGYHYGDDHHYSHHAHHHQRQLHHHPCHSLSGKCTMTIEIFSTRCGNTRWQLGWDFSTQFRIDLWLHIVYRRLPSPGLM